VADAAASIQQRVSTDVAILPSELHWWVQVENQPAMAGAPVEKRHSGKIQHPEVT